MPFLKHLRGIRCVSYVEITTMWEFSTQGSMNFLHRDQLFPIFIAVTLKDKRKLNYQLNYAFL